MREALAQAGARLAEAGMPTPKTDARRLLAHALGVESAGLTARGSEPLPADRRTALDEMITARMDHVPVSHLLGYREFWKHRFTVTPEVLDPRADTELLVELEGMQEEEDNLKKELSALLEEQREKDEQKKEKEGEEEKAEGEETKEEETKVKEEPAESAADHRR